MNNDYILRQEELVENPTARVPVCLVLDVSGSMSGDPIAELQEGIVSFFHSVKSDSIAQYSAEVSMVTFGGTVEKLLDFGSIQNQTIPELEAWGSTPMGEAVLTALDLLETRKAEYKNAGIDYYQPWLVLMTDGEATDNIEEAARRTAELVQQKKLTVFPIGIGSHVNLQELQEFSPDRPPLRLKGLSFKEFFTWLSQSVSRVSQSTPGERVELDTSTINKWGSV